MFLWWGAQMGRCTIRGLSRAARFGNPKVPLRIWVECWRGGRWRLVRGGARLDVFVPGGDAGLWHMEYSSSSWKSWVRVDGGATLRRLVQRRIVSMSLFGGLRMGDTSADF